MLTRDRFKQFKTDYGVYGTHTARDKYRNERTITDDTPRGYINVMWQPLTDSVAIAEYGRDISTMYFAIVYELLTIRHNDVIYINGEPYEVVGIKQYCQCRRVEVRRKKAG